MEHKLPKKYWQEKIQANVDRDRRTFTRFRRSDWRVMRVWEHELTAKRREKTLLKVRDFLLRSD